MSLAHAHRELQPLEMTRGSARARCSIANFSVSSRHGRKLLLLVGVSRESKSLWEGTLKRCRKSNPKAGNSVSTCLEMKQWQERDPEA
jgi:hypothetical protein